MFIQAARPMLGRRWIACGALAITLGRVRLSWGQSCYGGLSDEPCPYNRGGGNRTRLRSRVLSDFELFRRVDHS